MKRILTFTAVLAVVLAVLGFNGTHVQAQVKHDFTLKGDGTDTSPLGIHVPLHISSSENATISVSNIGNGDAIQASSKLSYALVGLTSQGKGGVRGVVQGSGTGVEGVSTEGTGVSGTGANTGVFAQNSNGNKAYLGARCCAGDFYGNVYIHGQLDVEGAKHFVIDSPLDPANKYLYHASVESSEMKNLYDGVAVLNAKGETVVELPEWFEALNKDFRYQLTAVGAPAPTLYIAQEIKNNRFKIAGGKSGVKVSWMVTGIRQDAWARANPMLVEQEKPENERGTYLYPDLFNQPARQGIEQARHPGSLRQVNEGSARLTISTKP